VLPVVERLAAQVRVPISVDTVKAGVARAALEAGASVVNDVAANREEELMWKVVAEHGAGYVAVHVRGTPRTMQDRPVYEDVAGTVRRFFEGRLVRLEGSGVGIVEVAWDVGIGFGKTLEHNLQLLAGLSGFTRLGRPMVLGVSRKSFIGRLLGSEVDARLPGSLACACWAVMEGVQLLRVHDVAETVQAVRMIEALCVRRHGDDR
jgi:dihydropteroate synthase